jgi:RNAse (barnase) inhibitor barstar
MSAKVIPPLLQAPHEPWLLEVVGNPGQGYEFAWAAAADGITSRVLRGSKMTRRSELYDEVGAVLQFPDYFGDNQAALRECLTDLSWLPGEAYLLVMVDAVKVLDQEPPESFAMFVETLTAAAREWATPAESGEAWDRPAIPFHVGFQVDAAMRETLRERFTAVDAQLAEWESWSRSGADPVDR